MPAQADPTLRTSPLPAAYWHAAARQLKDVRTLAFSALMIAVCVALSYVPSIPIVDGIKVSWGFLARALCGLVGGPLNALVFGAAEDTISYLMNPGGPYFPGYMLTTMLGTFIYALFLYRARLTVLRIFLAKLSTSILNMLLGSLWSAILYSKGYLFYVTTRAVTYTVTLPLQTIMLVALFSALVPVLARAGLLPPDQGDAITPW